LLGVCATLQGAAAAEPANPAAAATPLPLTLSVDLTDTARRVYRVQENVPASAGHLVLQYPKWVPGEHGPTGPLDSVAGLTISADGQPLPWRRDLEDMFALHVEVPPGARAVDLAFQYLSPGPGHNFGGGVSATPEITVLEWNQVVFYPAGSNVSRLGVQARVSLPPDWGWATALEPAQTGNSEVSFQPTSLETLVDSPLAAGRHFRQIHLTSGAGPVRLDLFADRPEFLAATEEQVRQHQRIVAEAQALFGARHYGHYDFLFMLSDQTNHFGLEHHQSSDDRTYADFFTDADAYLVDCDLLTHEYVHSWNGKFRRPAGLMTTNYNQPMKGDLLWVYEGLTQYWGAVLAARAGLRNAEQFRDSIAVTAAQMESTPGRTWRPLQDTADAAQRLYDAPRSWQNWRRSVDYYPEGLLLWLDIDTLLREKSHGERSLDDFAHIFFGRDDGSFVPQGYTFDDIVVALEKVQHLDWAHFLRQRLDAKVAGAPLDGIVRGGWKLVYTEEPSSLSRAQEKVFKSLDLSASLGLMVATGDPDEPGAASKGMVEDVVWKRPAFDAGLTPGVRLVAVNGTQFGADVLKDAIKAARSSAQPIELLVQDFDQFRTVKIDYHGGLRYPHLARIENTDERLDAIGQARAPK
jgi:predicted metalloprotease with PDZ domain